MTSHIDEQVFLSDTENIDPVIHPIMKRHQPSFHLTSSKTLWCQQSHHNSIDEPFYDNDSNSSLKEAVDSYRSLEQSKSLSVWSEYFRCHRKTQQQQSKDHKNCERCGKSCPRGLTKVRACENCCKLFGTKSALAMHSSPCRRSVKSAAAAGVILGINRSPDFKTYSRLRAKHRNESTTTTSIEQVPYQMPNENDDGAAIGAR